MAYATGGRNKYISLSIPFLHCRKFTVKTLHPVEVMARVIKPDILKPFWPCHVILWILISQSGIEYTLQQRKEAQSSNHWTTRTSQRVLILNCLICQEFPFHLVGDPQLESVPSHLEELVKSLNSDEPQRRIWNSASLTSSHGESSGTLLRTLAWKIP